MPEQNKKWWEEEFDTDFAPEDGHDFLPEATRISEMKSFISKVESETYRKAAEIVAGHLDMSIASVSDWFSSLTKLDGDKK